MDMRILVGQNFCRLRQAAGLTQEEVAERSGFSQQYICGLERGHRNPTVVSVFELTQAIGAEPVDLFRPTG